MKNSDLVRTAESYKRRKGTESHGHKGLTPLSDFSPDNPPKTGEGAERVVLYAIIVVM